jgi:hypothetical protein
MTIQEEAKARSEDFLRKKGIRVNEALPFIEDISELTPQSAQSVAQRCIVLGYMIGIGFDQAGSKLKEKLNEWDLYQFTSSQERMLLEKSEYSEQEKTNATWLTECVQSMAWGLGIAEIDHQRRCDDDLGPKFPIMQDPREFIENSSLKPMEDIYFQSDLLYRMHWASRDDRLNSRPLKLEEGLISERRKGMDWMLGVEQDWDEVPMDT